MYVCVCNGVTDRDIRRAADAGCRELAELTARTGCASACGCCASLAAALLDEAELTRPQAEEVAAAVDFAEDAAWEDTAELLRDVHTEAPAV